MVFVLDGSIAISLTPIEPNLSVVVDQVAPASFERHIPPTAAPTNITLLLPGINLTT